MCTGIGITILELCLLEKGVIGVFWSREGKEEEIFKRTESLKGKYSDNLIELLRQLLRWNPGERIKADKLVRTLERLIV